MSEPRFKKGDRVLPAPLSPLKAQKRKGVAGTIRSRRLENNTYSVAWDGYATRSLYYVHETFLIPLEPTHDR